MGRKIKRSDCDSCYNEFYHCGGATGNTKKCWLFDGAELTMGRILHIDQMPKDYRGRFKLIPTCFRKQRYFVDRKQDSVGFIFEPNK